MNLKIRCFSLFLCFNFIFHFGYPQTTFKEVATELKKIEFVETNTHEIYYEVFSVCKVNPNINFNEKLSYYWYSDLSGVKDSKGGCGGQLLHGKYQLFNKEENLKREYNYYLGLENGDFKEWNDKGIIHTSGKNEMGNLKYMKIRNDSILTFTEWINGFGSSGSIRNEYSFSGELLQRVEYFDLFRRTVIIYFDNGIVETRFTYGTSDLYDGDYIENYFNGKPKVKGQYDEGIPVGDFYFYNENGVLTGVNKYKIEKQYYPDGRLKVLGGKYYNNGEWVNHGKWEFYKDIDKPQYRFELIEKVINYKFGEEIIQ